MDADRLLPGTVRALLVNLGYAVSLTVVSLMAAPPRVPILSRTDWLAHGLAYGVQVLLLHELFRNLVRPGAAIAASVVIALVFGAVVESLQLLQPVRFFELSDLVANAVGVGVAAALLGIVRVPERRRKTETVL